jgi:3-oxoacyl-[acyl-carrier protein] reductase
MENDKKVLVTGTDRGIGRAIALAISKAGYSLIAHYRRNKEGARSLEQEILSHG